MLPSLSGHESMSNVDAAWLQMEEPTNLMMVSGVMTFKEVVPFDDLKRIIEHRLVKKYDRFRQRVVKSRVPLVASAWEYDPNFDLRSHLSRIALPSPGDEATLKQLSSEIASTPLDFSKPLWHVYLVENYGSGSAVIVRLHHCIADGIALVMVLLSLTDLSAKHSLVVDEDAAAVDKEPAGFVSSLIKQAFSAVGTAGKLAGRALNEGWETFQHPENIFDVARLGADSLSSLSNIALRPNDPHTILRGKLGTRKSTTWTEPISLEEVKFVRRQFGATVNDVLLTAMTGALRRYLAAHEQPTDGIEFHAAIPFNIRKQEEMGQLGNKFGLVFLKLPVGTVDLITRLRQLKERMDQLKNSPEAVIAFGILGALGASPTEIQRLVVNTLGQKVTAVITNVPGPPVPLYMAGQKIDSLMFWVPQSGHVGLGISILSYAGRVHLGIISDEGLIPDPDAILADFGAEFAEMLALARVQASLKEVAADGRCQATTKAGQRCKIKAMPGQKVCHFHKDVVIPDIQILGQPDEIPPTQFEAFMASLNRLADTLSSQTPSFTAPPFSRQEMLDFLRENRERFAPESLGVIDELRASLEGAKPEDFLDPDTWRGMWFIINYSLQNETEPLRHGLAERLANLPGASVLIGVRDSLADANARDFLDIDTWKGLGFIIQYSLQQELEDLRERVQPANDDE